MFKNLILEVWWACFTLFSTNYLYISFSSPGFVSATISSTLSLENVESNQKMHTINIYNLRKRKQKGLFKKRQVSLSSVLFPGASPNEFQRGQEIPIWIDLVDSRKTQLPFEYYDLPVCPAHMAINKFTRHRKNLGERLGGHHVAKPAPYNIYLRKDIRCNILCNVDFDEKKIHRLIRLIQRQYNVHLSLDGLPVYMKDSEYGVAVRGYPLGSKLVDITGVTYYIHNHLRFVIGYNDKDSNNGIRIVDFRVKPVSIAHETSSEIPETCTPESTGLVNDLDTLLPLRLPIDEDYLNVLYSYEVEWQRSETRWADRWDIYLLGRPDDSLAHHMSIINSFMVVLFLAAVVAIILVKALRRDIALYNDISTNSIEDDDEETGWKLVHGDVFRPPSFSPMALSIAVGTGCQIGAAVLITLVLGMTSFLNPMNKGQCLTYIVILYVLSGVVAGYFSARLYKFSGGKDWKANTLYTAVTFPGVCMSMFLILNFFLACVGAATTVSIWVILAVFFLWACVASPLVFIGSFWGFKCARIQMPTRTNQIARIVPPQNWAFNSNIASLIVGGMPFSTVCIEVYFIMGAIWLHQHFYLMGYLLAAVILLGTTCALMSAVMCYIRLCAEDHRWWWKSFADGASSGVWLFLYSMWYLSTRLGLVGILPVIVYVTYMSMISIAFSLYCGAMGFLTSLWFTRTIYSAVKID